MKNKFLIIITSLGILVIFALILLFPRQKVSADLDVFAECLADKNITMYGASWCPHCQREKKAFGDSFRLVPYVECPDNIDKCLAKGINGYPTWIFPATADEPNGKKLEGEQGLEKLSEESSCPLPSGNQKI
jgi:thiol-disulfide isomerase/thioredoxin